jgi:hypothetical protein
MALLCLIPNTSVSESISLSASVQFIRPVTLAEPTPIQFGKLETSVERGSDMVLAPNGTVSGQVVSNHHYLGEAAAGSIDVSAASPVSIVISNISSAHSSTFILSEPMCSIGSSSASPCGNTDNFVFSPSNNNKLSLLIGMTLTNTAEVYSEGSYQEDFDLTIVYQ